MYFDKRKKSELKKKCPIFAGLSIEKLTPSTSILAEKGQKNATFQNGQTHKNREVERGLSVELDIVSSTPCPPI